MGDTLKYLLYVLPVIGVVALVFYLIIRKQNRKTDAFKNALTKEQKDRLINTKPVRADASRGGFILEALVVELRDKGAKTFVRLMWFNALIQNRKVIRTDIIITVSKENVFSTSHIQSAIPRR